MYILVGILTVTVLVLDSILPIMLAGDMDKFVRTDTG